MKAVIDRSLYDLLGVQPLCTVAEIKTSYRAAVKRHHPDRGGDPDIFVSITRAYNVLCDGARRKLYDETGMFDTDAADQCQRDVVITLSGALDLVLSRTSLDIANADFVAEMQTLIRTGLDILAKDLATLESRLGSLKSVHKRLKRKDETASLFVRVIDTQIKLLADTQDTKRKAYYAQQRALEELARYDSFVEIAQSIHFGLPQDEPEKR